MVAGTVDVVVTGGHSADAAVDAVSSAGADTVSAIVVAATTPVVVDEAVAVVEGLMLSLLPMLQ